MRKIQKNLLLPEDVVDRLEDESNQSAKVAELLREEYDL